jgi:hypothetical protein
MDGEQAKIDYKKNRLCNIVKNDVRMIETFGVD